MCLIVAPVTPAFVAMAFEMDDVGANGTEVQRSSEPLNGSQSMNAALTPGDVLQAPALSAMPETEDPHSQCSLRCLLASSSQTSASANSNKSRTQAKTIMVRTVVACNLLCIYAAARVWFDQYTRNQEDCHRDRDDLAKPLFKCHKKRVSQQKWAQRPKLRDHTFDEQLKKGINTRMQSAHYLTVIQIHKWFVL